MRGCSFINVCHYTRKSDAESGNYSVFFEIDYDKSESIRVTGHAHETYLINDHQDSVDCFVRDPSRTQQILAEGSESWSIKEVALLWEGKAKMIEVLYRIQGETS
jgi:hypothetical protein